MIASKSDEKNERIKNPHTFKNAQLFPVPLNCLVSKNKMMNILPI